MDWPSRAGRPEKFGSGRDLSLAIGNRTVSDRVLVEDDKRADRGPADRTSNESFPTTAYTNIRGISRRVQNLVTIV